MPATQKNARNVMVEVLGNGQFRKTTFNAPAHSHEQLPVAPVLDASGTDVYAADLENDLILVDATAGAGDVQLPSAAGNEGKTYTVKKTDAGINAVTVLPDGTELIDGAANFALAAQYDSVTLVAFTDAAGVSGWAVLATV